MRSTYQAAVTPSGDRGVDRLALAVAGHGLGGTIPLPSEPVTERPFEELLRVGERDRLLGAMAELVADGVLPVTEDQRQRLAERHKGAMRHALDVERMLVRVGECFDRAEIDFRVLKGVALAQMVYRDPSWRIFGDLDLLVPSARFDDAVRVARTELGGKQSVPELRPGFDREFGKEAMVRVGRIELDLHRTFVTGPFGLTIDLDDLFRPGTPFEVGGRQFTALEPTMLCLHACYNLALGDHPVRLCALRDLLAVHQRSGLANDTIAAAARRWRAIAVVQRAAQLTVDLLELDASHELAALAALNVPHREAWLLRSYLTTARSYSRPLASLAVIPGVAARVRYARALLSPSAEYLRSRGWTGPPRPKQQNPRSLHSRASRPELLCGWNAYAEVSGGAAEQDTPIWAAPGQESPRDR